MKDETERDQKTKASLPTPDSGVGAVPKDAFMTVSADLRLPTPDAARVRLSWDGSGVSVKEHIDYECEAAHLDLRSDTGALIGRMFSLSYVSLAEGDRPDPARPVTFAYNGGPGCASVPINFGGIGPRRVRTDGVSHLAFPVEVEDNPSTLLRQSDLVFLDALGPAGGRYPKGPAPTR